MQKVREVLDAVVNPEPERVDRRAEADTMACRYVENGCPSCLVGVILYRLGFSVGRLKMLDRAAQGEPILLHGSGLDRYFTPLAFELLCYLQRSNDAGLTWGKSRENALTPDRYWSAHPRWRYHRKPWLAETTPLDPHPIERTP